MEEKRRSGYLGDVAWTGRDISFPSRCKSEIITIIINARKLMSCLNSSITSQYLTELWRKNGAPGTWTGRDTSFPPRCNFQIIAIITSATKLMSCPNSSITSQYLTYLQRKKRRFGYSGDRAVTGRDMSFSRRCKSKIISIITGDTKLMSCPNSRVTSEYLT